MAPYFLCEFYVQRIAFKGINLLAFSEGNFPNGLEEVARRLGIDPLSAPLIFKEMANSTLFNETLELDPYDVGLAFPDSIFDIENEEEWESLLTRFSEGIVLMEDYGIDVDTSFTSGYGKLACVVQTESINWSPGSVIVCGNFALTLLSKQSFSAVMEIDFNTIINESVDNDVMEKGLNNVKPALFREVLMSNFNVENTLPLMLAAAKDTSPLSSAISLMNDELSEITIHYRDDSHCVISIIPFSHHLLSDRDIVENYDALYISLTEDLERQGYQVSFFDQSKSGYPLGSTFRQLYWFKGPSLPLFPDGEIELSPQHLASHLKDCGVVSFAQNRLLSSFTGEPVLLAVSGFNREGDAIVNFQIEFYSGSGNEEYRHWLNSLMSKMAQSEDDFIKQNDWEFNWHINNTKDRIYNEIIGHCKFPARNLRNIHLLTINLLCDGFVGDYNMDTSQEVLEWFFDDYHINMNIETQAFPLLLIPESRIESVSRSLERLLSSNKRSFPLVADELNSVSSSFQSLTTELLMSKSPNEPYRYVIFVAVSCTNLDLADFLHAFTHNVSMMMAHKNQNESLTEYFIHNGNLPSLSKNKLKAGEFYNLSGFRGGYLEYHGFNLENL